MLRKRIDAAGLPAGERRRVSRTGSSGRAPQADRAVDQGGRWRRKRLRGRRRLGHAHRAGCAAKGSWRPGCETWAMRSPRSRATWAIGCGDVVGAYDVGVWPDGGGERQAAGPTTDTAPRCSCWAAACAGRTPRWALAGPGTRSTRYQGRDLAVTTDFRDLFGEVLARMPGPQISPRCSRLRRRTGTLSGNLLRASPSQPGMPARLQVR